MQCGSYRGIKLVEHAMKVIERVLEMRIRQQVEIDAIWIYARHNGCNIYNPAVARKVPSKAKELLF